MVIRFVFPKIGRKSGTIQKDVRSVFGVFAVFVSFWASPGHGVAGNGFPNHEDGRVPSQTRALGTRFVAIFCLGKRHPYQNKFCEKRRPRKRKSDAPKIAFGYDMARGVLRQVVIYPCGFAKGKKPSVKRCLGKSVAAQ